MAGRPTPRENAVAINAAARGASRARNGTGSGRVTLSNGIVLRLKPVPPFAVRQAAIAVIDPPVPTVWIADKERNEPNPNDPDYIDAVNRANEQRIEAVTNLFFMMGTEVEAVPDGMFRPEDDGWIDMLEVVGLPVDRANQFKRHYQWVAWYAAQSEHDISTIMTSVATLSGVSEADVQVAIRSFRD